jgi:hypothetical protein
MINILDRRDAMTDKSIDLENRTKITTGEKTIFEILEVL